MIEYSKQESEIFNVPFGRLNIDEDFEDWTSLQQAVTDSNCKYIRIKIQNPRATQLDHILSLAPKVHLLEILRVYRSPDLSVTPFQNEHEEFKIKIVDEKHSDKLAQFIFDTYEDIPFGNYTPASILKIFPTDLQLNGIVEYFKEYYCGKDEKKAAYLFYNASNKPIGCIVTDYFDNGKGSSGSYSYYVAIARDERNKGYQYKVVNYIKFLVTERGYKFLDGSTRLTNLYSARTMEKVGCKCIRYDWVYLLEK
ncbi:MAG: hypothetical protein R2739_06555 [Chitinophagales bacterium]|nr:hypothetical protein [Bacteroidota bacterium]